MYRKSSAAPTHTHSLRLAWLALAVFMRCNARSGMVFWLARNSVVTFVASGYGYGYGYGYAYAYALCLMPYGVMLVIQHGLPKELALNPTAGVVGAAGDDFLYTV